MTKHAPEHFSVAFKFDVNKPSRKSDRITLRLILPGMFLGFILAALGAYEWIMRNYYNTSTSLIEKFPINKNTLNESFMNPTVFDAIIFLIGVGIVTSLFFSYVKYKKIIFDGKNFEVITRPVFGKKRSFKEPLKKYAGVLLRIEFFQYGFINRNKYIIELSHKNPEKSVPLYISMRAKNIRHIWKEYAKKLNMPAIVETEEGLKSTDVEDLDKPLIELVKEKKIKPKSNEKKPLPKAVAYTKKKDKTIIKAREIVWDAYNVIAWAVIAYIAFLAAFVGLQYSSFAEKMGTPMTICFIAAAVVLVVASVFALFRKDKIVIKKHKLIIVHKFMLFSRKKQEISKYEIEAVYANLNPATGRYFLTISGFNKTLVFGKKLPVESLKWVRDFLTYEITK